MHSSITCTSSFWARVSKPNSVPQTTINLII
nr:MAG TPA: hypothetical protein [Caudoviricetes sp.]